MSRSISQILFKALRWFWLLYTGSLWVLWLISLPSFLDRAAAGTLPTITNNGTAIAQLASANAAAWGVAVYTWAWIHIIVAGLCILVTTLIALVIWWRLQTGFGLLTAYVLFVGVSNFMENAIYSAALSETAVMLWELGAIIWPLFFLWLYLFPTGHPIPRWLWRFFVLLLIPFFILFMLYLSTQFVEAGSLFAQMVNRLQPVFNFLITPLFLLVGAAQIYRYGWVSGAVERGQTKWFLFGLAILIFPTALISLLTENYPAELDTLAFTALPIGIGISILRYRLWDIDLIIRKTVQYGAVTAVLSLIYFGTVIMLQSVVGRATGEQSTFVIVLSTLLIAGLFNPLRGRVQTAVDRRFYRQKYDPAQVLADFAQVARDETDMTALQAELLRVVQESLQPETVSIWLKK